MLSESDDFEIIIEEDSSSDSGIQATDETASSSDLYNITDKMFTNSMDLNHPGLKTKRSVCFSETVKTCDYGRADPAIGVSQVWTKWAFSNIVASMRTVDTICSLDWAAVDWTGMFHGSINTKNLSFEKQVVVRLSVDDWISFVDISAQYQKSIISTQCDIFEFDFDLNSLDIDGDIVIDFAVCCHMNGIENWDNNGDANYQIRTTCTEQHPSTPSVVPLKEPCNNFIDDEHCDEERAVQSSCSGVYANYFLPTSILLRDWSSI